MRDRRFLNAAAVAWLVLGAVPALAIDVSQIDRSIRKEPVYESNEPQYCLLVFGPEANARSWLVLDGDTLYVDRNGNGDLTEPEDRVSPLHVYHQSEERPDIEVIRLFWLPTPEEQTKQEKLKSGILPCFYDVTALIVEQCVPSRDAPNKAWAESLRQRPFRVDVASESGWEQDGSVLPSKQPADAPVLHFLGPQQLSWPRLGAQELRRGEFAALGVDFTTPGIDGEVRAFTFPKEVRAFAEIDLPGNRWTGGVIHRRVELKPGSG